MRYDYIIVGGGTAGCVLANRLSADPDVTVLLLEAGGQDDYFWIDIPVGYLYTIGNPRTDWCYTIEPDPGLNGRTIGYARGKVLGGCSSINAMIYMRGQKTDYDHWASLGNRGWSWDDVLPVFKRSEDYQHGADEFHGVGGEMRVEEKRVSWEILEAWRDAAEECGIPKIAEFNRGDNFGNAYFQMNQRGGRRWSGTKAYLRPVMARSNLTVRVDAQVERIASATGDAGRRATGVRLVGNSDVLEARREVILAAGSIGSPQILQLSGIGPGAVLRQHGIEVVHDLPGVGENLHDHLQIRTMYKVKHTVTLNQRFHSLFGKAAMGLEYLLFKTGPLTMPPSQLGAFAKSDPSRASANMEWHVQPLSLDKFGDPLHTFNAITPSVCNLQPTSRGHVRIKSAGPLDAPAITLNYLSTEQDRRIAIVGLRFTRRIMAANALARFEPEEWKPGAEVESDEALGRAAADLGSTIFHPVGTCKMGHDDLAVVDDRLAVHGIAGLRVIDASIMPRITSGNTNAPTVMIAEKGRSSYATTGTCDDVASQAVARVRVQPTCSRISSGPPRASRAADVHHALHSTSRLVLVAQEGGSMKRSTAVILTLLAIGVVSLQPPSGVSAQAAGWTTLFDGSTLDGWNVLGTANWELEDGAVQAESGSGFLVTPESYADFELTLEFWVDEPANSGIFIRCADPESVRDTNCYEVNIYDTRADQTYRTGGIVHIASPTSVINAGGRWNTYEIVAQGPQLTVTLNGTQVVQVEDSQFAEGPIALQYGAGVVKFRNVRIRRR